MASAWSSTERWCRENRKKILTPTARIKELDPSDEHTASLADPGRFDSLHRKDNFFDAGIGTIFGVRQGTAELQSFRFRPGKFTPAEARRWLQEHGFKPLLFVEGDAT
jgi:hypothetical protein